MKKLFTIIIFVFSFNAVAVDYVYNQFDILGGLGVADADNSTGLPESGMFVKFQSLTSSGDFLRGMVSFAGMQGTAIGGDFGVGFMINPFAHLTTVAFPYVGASGLAMIGQFNDQVQVLYGYSIHTGLNLKLARSFALTLQMDYMNAGDAMYRYLGGFSFYFKQK